MFFSYRCGRLTRTQIDGHANPHLQTVHVPELPVSTAHFHPRGGALLLAGPRPFFTTLDLGSGAAVRSPRGLWGRAGAGDQELSLARCAFSPDGAALAVAGRGGTVHLVDWAAGAGGAQVVGSVKANTPVKALWWAAPPGAAEGAANELMTLGADAEVYVWDVRARRCVRRWKDDGAFGACVMEGDSAGRHLAIGYVVPAVSHASLTPGWQLDDRLRERVRCGRGRRRRR
jgi:U3 small nucleolar RNA-associated protein 18